MRWLSISRVFNSYFMAGFNTQTCISNLISFLFFGVFFFSELKIVISVSRVFATNAFKMLCKILSRFRHKQVVIKLSPEQEVTYNKSVYPASCYQDLSNGGLSNLCPRCCLYKFIYLFLSKTAFSEQYISSVGRNIRKTAVKCASWCIFTDLSS